MSRDYAVAEDGVRIAYRDEGPPGRPVILFCTMGTAAMSVWDSVAGPLSANWRVILHDRRGDGDSDPGAPESHSFDTYVRDALAVLDKAGCPEAVVCGMAYGARVAVHLARDHPERVRGLILFDATGGPPAAEALRDAGSKAAARLRAEAGLPEIARDRAWFHRRDPTGAGLGRRVFADLPAWTPGLGTIRVRTLVACGEQDPNLEGAIRLSRDLPNATLELMAMTGHASILDRPQLVLSLISDFLGRPAPTSPSQNR